MKPYGNTSSLYRYPGFPVYYFVQIDWEESTLLQRVCVRPHIDEELDNRKHVYNGIDAVLSKVAEGICPTVPQDYATSLNVVYFPQLGKAQLAHCLTLLARLL